MNTRELSLSDQLIGEIDRAINVLSRTVQAARPRPTPLGGELMPTEAERRVSARLMRVNHSGEVAAQALYRGQALAARTPSAALALRQAAAEERDHLAWCESRIEELGGRTSLLNPLWYAGSFLIGAFAGLSGDRTSLGFITETERQVESHLRSHLDRLPAADRQSRAIVEEMSRDEARHGAKAASLGGREPPIWVKVAMKLSSKVMTGSSHWL